MNDKQLTHRWFSAPLLGLLLALLAVGVALAAVGNIDATNKWAWGTNVGWVNFAPDNGGVTVYSDHLEGYAWGENIGWIRLGAHSGGGSHTYTNADQTTYGVNNDGTGNLSGYAWGTSVGWINFAPVNGGVTIDPVTGDFDGYAWGENVGWIHFQNDSPAYKVNTVWRGAADVGVVKRVAPASAAPGQAITYTLSFSNTGPNLATGVVIRDSIPLSVTISRVTSSTVGSGVVITQTSAGPNFAWAVSDLAVGAGGVITLTGTLIPSAALIGPQITNTATITASNDITVTNNSSSAAVNVVGLPGTIIVRKVVVGRPPASAWQFNGPTGAYTLPATGGSRTFANLPPVPYTISETPQAGYAVASACSNGASGAASVRVTLGSGQSITCTFTNTHQAGTRRVFLPLVVK